MPQEKREETMAFTANEIVEGFMQMWKRLTALEHTHEAVEGYFMQQTAEELERNFAVAAIMHQIAAALQHDLGFAYQQKTGVTIQHGGLSGDDGRPIPDAHPAPSKEALAAVLFGGGSDKSKQVA